MRDRERPLYLDVGAFAEGLRRPLDGVCGAVIRSCYTRDAAALIRRDPRVGEGLELYALPARIEWKNERE